MSEFVIGVLIYFAYPSYSDYFIGKGDDKTSITDWIPIKTVTSLGDNSQVLDYKHE